MTKLSKKKILFIYGFNDNPDSQLVKDLKENLNQKRYEVISDYYAQYNPKDALIDINNYIKENKIDIVIGIELGGWLATLIENKTVKKILIDPTFNPLVEFDKEDGFPEYIMNFYKDYIDALEINNYNFSNVNILLTDNVSNEYEEINSDNITYIDSSYTEFSDIIKKFIVPLL